jgi:hypothetical protein
MKQEIRVVLAAGVASGLFAAPAHAAAKLIATVQPGSISFETLAGKRVTTLRSGTYVVVVRDRTVRDNFHLFYPPTVDLKTRIGFVGTKQWRIVFRPGVYAYFADAHRGTLKGSFRVR